MSPLLTIETIRAESELRRVRHRRTLEARSAHRVAQPDPQHRAARSVPTREWSLLHPTTWTFRSV